MPPREALVDDLQESARTVSLHLLGAGWVEASDATLATPLPRHPHPLIRGVVNQLLQVAGTAVRPH